MKDQINTIREALLDARSLLHDGRRQDKALTALDQIEKMVGSQVPVAWGMQHTDGAILDVISPEEHAREEGGYVVPLYRAAPVAQQPHAESYEELVNALHRIDSAAVFLPTFEVRHEGGIEAVTQNIVDAIQAACKQPQAEAVPIVQVVNCDTCKHSANSCDDYPCNRCGVEFGDGPFDRWEAPQQAEAVPSDVVRDAERWRMLPAYFYEYQIDAMKLYRDIDAAIAQQKGANHG